MADCYRCNEVGTIHCDGKRGQKQRPCSRVMCKRHARQAGNCDYCDECLEKAKANREEVEHASMA